MAVTPAAAPSRKKTNLVLFMTDDHGAWATGYNGCADTPNLDLLRRTGTYFSNAFAATPVCSPSRMTYITGKMPSSHGIQDFLLETDSKGPKAQRFLDGQVTWTQLLASAGYTLGLSGKWHMGVDDQAQAGFTFWATVPGGGGTYKDPGFVKNGQKLDSKGFKTDLQGDYALEFLDSVSGKPFVLMMPFYAPHTPYDTYPERDAGSWDQVRAGCYPDTPMNANQNSNLAKNIGQLESKQAYSALVAGADINVGRVLRKLDAMGVRENTVVIFTADQGFNCGHHGVWGKGNGTVPYNLYEESIRVPMIWNQPRRIAAGRTVEALISSYDFFPTVLDYLGVKPPPRDRKRTGRSYAGFLQGRAPEDWRDRLYFEYAYMRSVRTKNLKYIERTKNWPSELYDLEADPGETRDLLADPDYASRLQSLRADLHRFFDGVGAPPIEDWKMTTKQELPERQRVRGGE